MRRLTSGRLSIIFVLEQKRTFGVPDYGYPVDINPGSDTVRNDRITIMNSKKKLRTSFLTSNAPVPCQSPDVKMQLL